MSTNPRGLMSKSPNRSMARIMQKKPAEAVAETKAKRRIPSI
jgi:hypothetical protein